MRALICPLSIDYGAKVRPPPGVAKNRRGLRCKNLLRKNEKDVKEKERWGLREGKRMFGDGRAYIACITDITVITVENLRSSWRRGMCR